MGRELDGDLSFLHVSIRSLNKNKSLLGELMFSYKVIPDIIGVCEIKINESSNTNFLTLTGYDFH